MTVESNPELRGEEVSGTFCVFVGGEIVLLKLASGTQILGGSMEALLRARVNTPEEIPSVLTLHEIAKLGLRNHLENILLPTTHVSGQSRWLDDLNRYIRVYGDDALATLFPADVMITKEVMTVTNLLGALERSLDINTIQALRAFVSIDSLLQSKIGGSRGIGPKSYEILKFLKAVVDTMPQENPLME